MMNKDEAVQKLAKVAHISVAYAEDLYDSFFEKPVVPQFVADWYEEHKTSYDYELWDYLSSWEYQKEDNFKKWIGESYESDKRIITLVNMHQFGYEVGKGHRYIVKFKGVSGDARYLNHETDGNWYINSRQETHQFRVAHTRKELEEANFGWVFDCEGVEVKEVK
jgi:hypothetical protein